MILELSQAEKKMWNGFVLMDSAFEIESDIKDTVQDARAKFEQKVKKFGQWGGLKSTPSGENIGCIEDACGWS